jgi:hypothetical protein
MDGSEPLLQWAASKAQYGGAAETNDTYSVWERIMDKSVFKCTEFSYIKNSSSFTSTPFTHFHAMMFRYLPFTLPHIKHIKSKLNKIKN